jgi:SRSO17 transposase
MFGGMGRSERRHAMALYTTGLLLDGERKSIEPMAARLAANAEMTEAMRQRLQQCVSVSNWEALVVVPTPNPSSRAAHRTLAHLIL